MDYRDDYQDFEIDLIEFFWYLCLRWKPILIVAVAAGLLIGCFYYVRNSANVEETVDYTSEDELKAVEIAVDRSEVVKNRLEQYEQYTSESYIPTLDPYNLSEARVYFYITSSSERRGDLSVVNTMYQSKANSEDFARKLGDALGLKKDPSYIKEIFSTYSTIGNTMATPIGNTMATPGDSYLLVASMILPDGVDGQKFIDVVTDLIMDIKINNKEFQSPYDITPVDSAIETGIDRDYESQQVTMDQTLDSYRSSLNALDDAFNENQLALYNFMTGNNEEVAASDTGADASAAAPQISTSSILKYIILGMFAGAFCCAGVLLIISIMRPRVGRMMGSDNVAGIKSFGTIPVQKNRTKWTDFIISPFVQNILNKNKGSDEQRMRDAAIEMEFGLNNSYPDEKAITLLTVEKPSPECEDALVRLKSKLSDLGVEAVSASLAGHDVEKTLQKISELKKAGSIVVLACEAEKTLFKDYSVCIHLLKESEVRILGSVLA